MTKVGDIYTLWTTKYSREAYNDQMGRSHSGYFVREQIIVTVHQVKHDVIDMWTGERRHTGLLAYNDCDEEFKCNWEVFPSDSMTPTYYWQAVRRNGDLVQPVDSVQAYNGGFSVYAFDNKKALPIGNHVKHCTKHDKVYYTWTTIGCFNCHIEVIKASRR